MSNIDSSGGAPDAKNIDVEQVEPQDTQAAIVLQLKNHSHDADVALKALEGHTEIIEIDEQTNKRLLRIIDWNLLPIMCLVYGINFLDKITISFAATLGMNKDIGLVGDNFQWLSSIFYIGYLGFEWPTNLLLQRLPLAKYSAFCIIAWGIIQCCFAAVTNFGGGVVIRLLLGIFEASVSPGFALFTSQWYTQKEHSSRTSLWTSANGIMQIVGSLVAYGIAEGTKTHTPLIAGWKIIFLVAGLLTVALGIIFLFVMPDNQLNARFLKPEDRLLAIERVRVNQQGIGNKHYKVYQLKQTLLDPLSWAIFLYTLISNIPNAGLSTFFSQLIVSFGYTAEQSLLYSCPAGAVLTVAMIGSGYLGAYTGQRILVSMIGLLMAILGILLIICLPLSNNLGRLIGYYLANACVTPLIALLALIPSDVAGWTRKTTVAALYFIGYCAGAIIGPQTFRPQDAPRYVPAQITILCCWGVCMIDLLFIWWWLRRQNRIKAAIRALPGYTRLENQEFLDLTDIENPEFVYAI